MGGGGPSHLDLGGDPSHLDIGANPSYHDVGVALPTLMWGWPFPPSHEDGPPTIKLETSASSEVFLISSMEETNPGTALCLTLAVEGLSTHSPRLKHRGAVSGGPSAWCSLGEKGTRLASSFAQCTSDEGLKTKNFDWEQSTGSWSR